MIKLSKTDVLFGVIVLAMSSLLLVTHQSNVKQSQAIATKESELLKLDKEYNTMFSEYDAIQRKLDNEKAKFFKEVSGFQHQEIEQDNDIVLNYLDKMFTWTSGDQYDKQREEIRKIGALGTDELLKTIMTENYRVEVPENLKGKIKDNDIDVNGLKSKLVSSRFHRTSWQKSDEADITYVARISYQIYINESDLSGDYKTLRSMLFTFKLSGLGDARKITSVQYAFVQ